MYKLKEKLDITITHKELAEKVGITPEYLSEINNGRACRKLTAYSICKMINKEYEIENLFKREE